MFSSLLIMGSMIGGVALTTVHNVAQYQPLRTMWEQSKQWLMDTSSGRMMDPGRNYRTASEGQAYAMLRSVWADDRDMFNRSWQWTWQNLQHKQDKLFAWQWGQRSDGTWGIIEQNSASDADTDIALALVLAARRWGDDSYRQAAVPIIRDIWEREVEDIHGQPYLIANNVEKSSSEPLTLNPSYYAPYAYRLFAGLDQQHEWMRLVDATYTLLDRLHTDPLDASRSAGLPPDWIAVSRQTGNLTRHPAGHLTTNYGYDAMRLAWRIQLDNVWNHDGRAVRSLQQMGRLSEAWRADRRLPSVYHRDGSVDGNYESGAMNGTAIGYFLGADAQLVHDVYAAKLAPLYDTQSGWRSNLGYYDDNWAWFGIGLYHGALSKF